MTGLRAHVFDAMGTAVSVTAAGLTHATMDAVRGEFERLEGRFSLYRDESEASAIARRELLVPDASPEYRRVYAEAADWRALTGGAFTPHRPDGAIDLSGIVKALAIQHAAALLHAGGVTDYVINAGGDVATSGCQPSGRPWVVGIVDPDDRTALLSQHTCHATPTAVCTSGIAERGEHVWRVGADDTFAQVSVVASDVVTADVLATAILAGGPDALRWCEQHWTIDVLAVTRDGRLWATEAFRTKAA